MGEGMSEGQVGDAVGVPVDLALAAGALGTWEWDSRTGSVRWNTRMEVIFGFPPGGFDGTYDSYATRLHPDDVDDSRAVLERAMADRSDYRVEHRVIHPDGAVRWIRGVGRVLLDADGVAIGTTGCAADITDQVMAEAEQAGVLERLTFLAKASDMLSSSLDLTETLEQVAGLCVPRIADTAILVVMDGQRPQVLAARHADPSREALLQSLQDRRPVDLDGPGMGAAIRTGQPQLLPEIPDSMLVEAADDEEHLEMLRSLRLGSGLAVPLVNGTDVVGALGLGLDRGRRVTDDMRHIAQALASRAAVAIQHARLHKVATTVADALQAGLAPADLPTIEGLDLAARYVAAGEGVVVGGDFYDLIEVPEDGWLLTVGDVCGRGSAAAAVNAQLRFSARALARVGMPIAAVAEELNRDLIADAAEGMFCTAVLARLRVAEGGASVELVCAGHPAPVLVPADGPPVAVEVASPLLGVVPLAGYRSTMLDLRPGDALVVVTDGVLEARAADGTFFGEARLLEALATCPGDAQACADAVRAAVADFAGRPPDDDMAIVVVRAT